VTWPRPVCPKQRKQAEGAEMNTNTISSRVCPTHHTHTHTHTGRPETATVTCGVNIVLVLVIYQHRPVAGSTQRPSDLAEFVPECATHGHRSRKELCSRLLPTDGESR